MSIVNPPSFCPACKRRLKTYELVPIISYLALKGRCRTCGARIPLRVFIVEVGTALIFMFLFIKFDLSLSLLSGMVFSSLLIVLASIDLESLNVPKILTYPFFPILFFLSPEGWRESLIGMGAGFLMFFIPLLISRGGIGWGDVEVGALTGVFLGFPKIIGSITLSWLIGGAFAIFLLMWKRKKPKDKIPFIPFLSISSILFLFLGDKIISIFVI